jgi:hypothetical protein
MKIFTVREWGGQEVNNRRLPQQKPKGVVIHHTATPNRVAGEGDTDLPAGFQLAREIQVWHRRRGWRDSGQHFTVTRAGHILEGRNGSLSAAEGGMVLLGAHAGVQAANSTHWGIEVEGHYVLSLPPEVQLRSLAWLCAQLSLWGGTQATALSGHCDWKGTLCPGAVFYRYLPAFRVRVRKQKLALMGG